MGDRSNLIVITDRREINLAVKGDYDLVSGLALYSHWGGSEAQIHALRATREHGLRRLDDPAYFARIVARAFTDECDGELGAGITPVSAIAEHHQPSMSTLDQMTGLLPDNDGYAIPVIDLVTREIRIYAYNVFSPKDPFMIETLPLSAEGIDEAITVLDEN